MTKYCNKCNATIEENGLFCTQCGSNDIRDDQVNNNEETVEQPAEDTTPQNNDVIKTTPETTPENNDVIKTTPEQKKEVVKEEEKEEPPAEETTPPETTPPETTPPDANQEVTDASITVNPNPISIPTAVQAFDHAAPTPNVEQNQNSFANVPDFMYGTEENAREAVQTPVGIKPQQPAGTMNQQMHIPMKKAARKRPKTNIPIFAAIGVATFLIIIGLVFVISNNKNDELEQTPAVPFSDNDITVSGYSTESFDSSSLFTKENSFRVGDKDYGFISIPNTWTYFKDQENPSKSLQYTDNGTWIVTLFGKPTSQETAVDWANSVYLTITQSGAQNIEPTQAVIDGYKALSISAYYQSEGKYLTTWFLETKNGITHYLAIEGPQAKNENYNIIYSFKEDE